MEYVQISVDKRTESGGGAVRRLRRAGQVPGILYGLGRPNLMIAIADKELDRFRRSESHLVELKMGDKTRHAILRELQIDSLSDRVLHVDLSRVADDIEIEDTCRIEFKGRAKGTGEGGVFQPLSESIRVRALPKNLPGSILLDITELALGDAIRVSDLELPGDVVVLDAPEALICQVSTPKATADDLEDEVAGEDAVEPGA